MINGKQIIFIKIYKDIAHNNVEEKVGQLLSHLVLTSYKQYKYGQFLLHLKKNVNKITLKYVLMEFQGFVTNILQKVKLETNCE